MSSNQNADIAADTLKCLEAGVYTTPTGLERDLKTSLATAKAGTIFYEPATLEGLEFQARDLQTQVAVTPESTLEAARRITSDGSRVALLNFASAKNPGGGFLGGAQAQEESLARSSGLYPCLLTAQAFYRFHRSQHDLRYSHRMIFSPDVPFFKDDPGATLETLYLGSVITSAAPNYGAMEQTQAHDLPSVPAALLERAGLVLRLAAHHRHTNLILGAWGCGVFRNPPQLVASSFKSVLQSGGAFSGVFERVIFAVYDRSKSGATLEAFQAAFSDQVFSDQVSRRS